MRQLMDGIALSIGSAALLTLSSAVQAAPTPDSCSMKLKTLQFAGTFDWKNTKNGRLEKLRFVIGSPEHGEKGTSVAQIWAGKQCQASCSSVDLGAAPGTQALEKDELSLPISLDLQCRGEELGALSARVAVLWGHGSKSETTLRFGSWVDGYEQAALKVEVDHFNAPRLAIDR